MDLFHNAMVIRLKSHNNKYLHAKEDEESVCQDRYSMSKNNHWTVEVVTDSSEDTPLNIIRLKSCYNKYLTASDQHFLLGATGHKVFQTVSQWIDSTVEWEPIRVGNQVKFRTRYGHYLRANGGLPPWRNSITHDVSSRKATQGWAYWEVDVVDPGPRSLLERMDTREIAMWNEVYYSELGYINNIFNASSSSSSSSDDDNEDDSSSTSRISTLVANSSPKPLAPLISDSSSSDDEEDSSSTSRISTLVVADLLPKPPAPIPQKPLIDDSSSSSTPNEDDSNHTFSTNLVVDLTPELPTPRPHTPLIDDYSLFSENDSSSTSHTTKFSEFVNKGSINIPLQSIEVATKNFTTFLGRGGYGLVYKGELLISGESISVAVKRLHKTYDSGQGLKEFLTEIQLLSRYKHPNLVSLRGFCQDAGENILIYEYACHGSLDKYLRPAKTTCPLTWRQRVTICLDAAHGLDYLHNHVSGNQSIIHRDIKSGNILLDQNWKAMIADLGLSKLGCANESVTYLITNPCGTSGYCDPVYIDTGILTKESDVYSFGIVLFEVLSGRLCFISVNNEQRFLLRKIQRYQITGKLDEIVDPDLEYPMDLNSVKEFSDIATRCLHDDRRSRPSMGLVVKKLEKTLELLASSS